MSLRDGPVASRHRRQLGAPERFENAGHSNTAVSVNSAAYVGG